MWTKVVKTENNTKRIVPFFTIGTYSASDKDGITLAADERYVRQGLYGRGRLWLGGLCLDLGGFHLDLEWGGGQPGRVVEVGVVGVVAPGISYRHRHDALGGG